MKKLTFLIILALSIQVGTFAQNCLPDGITFISQNEIDNFQTNYPGCVKIEGDVTFNGSNITNLDGLSVLTAFGGDVWIQGCDNLDDLTGLDNVSEIGGDLLLEDNEALTSLEGLENIETVGGNLEISSNDLLENIQHLNGLTIIGLDLSLGGSNLIINLEGLDNVTSIGEDLTIYYNTNLASLSGLENLAHIGGNLWLNNNALLTDLSPLSNVASIDGYFLWLKNNPVLNDLSGIENADLQINTIEIADNPSLSDCAIESICQFIAGAGGTVNISGNAEGCSNLQEVEDECSELGVEENAKTNTFSILPNPANGKTTIYFELDTEREFTLTVLNVSGQEIINVPLGKKKSGNYDLNCSELSAGIYLITIKTDSGILTEKLIIE